MGEVVRARDERLGRDVAIKRMKNVFGTETASFHARFEAEARALAALTHPGVVQIYELGLDADEPYLVMELVDGPSLRAVIKEHGPLPAPAVRALGIQLARALEAAHGRGILHRDVKPANVLRAPGGAWKLADFGVAQMPDSEMTSTGQFIGTPAYAAPEALALAQFSPASDVFGLAATLLEAASGKKPRRDATLAELMARAHDSVELAGLPEELAAVLRPALAGEAKARPDAGELAELLAGSPDSERILAAIAARMAAASGQATVDLGWSRPAAVEKATQAEATAALRRPAAAPSAGPSTAGLRGPDRGPSAQSSSGLRGPDLGPSAQASVANARVTGAIGASGSSSGISSGGSAVATAPAGEPPPTATHSAAAVARSFGGWRGVVTAIVLVGVLAVVGRACTEEPSRSPGNFPAAGSLPAAASPGAYEEPLRFEMPPELDRKGAQAWAEVARAVNEGKLSKALDKLEKLERRFGESPQSGQLRRWLQDNAELEQQMHPHDDD